MISYHVDHVSFGDTIIFSRQRPTIGEQSCSDYYEWEWKRTVAWPLSAMKAFWHCHTYFAINMAYLSHESLLTLYGAIPALSRPWAWRISARHLFALTHDYRETMQNLCVFPKKTKYLQGHTKIIAKPMCFPKQKQQKPKISDTIASWLIGWL